MFCGSGAVPTVPALELGMLRYSDNRLLTRDQISRYIHVACSTWLSSLATLPRMQDLREHDGRDKCTSHHSGPHRDLACCIMHDTVICSAWVADSLCFSGAKVANVEEFMTEPDFKLDLPSCTDICDLDIIRPEDRIRANQAKSGQVVAKKSAEGFATKTICSGILQGKMNRHFMGPS